MTTKQLSELLNDTKWHDTWMRRGDRDVRYYDGDQLDPGLIQKMKSRGIAPLVRNYIRPTVDLVLGTEAKNKRDFRLSADDEHSTQAAEAMSAELKSIERTSEADRATSDALASMVKTGIGWVEVARSSDPFASPIRVTNIHRNEMFFDWRARQPDLSDARYLVRRRWYDVDTLQNWFPKHKTAIGKLPLDRADWDDSDWDIDEETLNQLTIDIDNPSIARTDWHDSDRKRLRLYEIWYKEWKNGFIVRLPHGKVVEFDPENDRQAMLVAAGHAQLEAARFLKPRQAYYIGPMKLTDHPSPYPHSYFPYVPFIAGRKDSIGEPIGLIYHMISPQDEINARLSKMMWLLSSKRVIGDADALKISWRDMQEQIAKPDASIPLNENRRNKNADAFRVETDHQLSLQQFQVMQDATRAIQDVAGVYQAQLGKESTADSGVAISSLVEQGSTTTAEMMDNYRYSYTHVGELMLALHKEDVGSQERPVLINRNGTKKTVLLNQRGVDGDGNTTLSNSVVNSRMHVALEEIPQTPSYRQQQFSMLTEVVKSLPPEVIPLFADFMVRSSDLPDREELVKRIQSHFGFSKDPEEMTPEEIQAQQDQADMQQESQQLALEEQRQTVEKLAAEIEQLHAKVRQIDVESSKMEEEMVLDVDKHIHEKNKPEPKKSG